MVTANTKFVIENGGELRTNAAVTNGSPIKFETEDPACPNEVEARLRIYEPVLRYLIVTDEADSE